MDTGFFVHPGIRANDLLEPRLRQAAPGGRRLLLVRWRGGLGEASCLAIRADARSGVVVCTALDRCRTPGMAGLERAAASDLNLGMTTPPQSMKALHLASAVSLRTNNRFAGFGPWVLPLRALERRLFRPSQ